MDNPDSNFALIKPASSLCNLNCKYCFYKDLDNHGKLCRRLMSYKVLQDTVAYVTSKARYSSSFLFQGGEPLLAGTEFFERYLALCDSVLLSRPNFKIYSSLQTSGVMLDKSFAQIFAKGRFLVGVSLDGPQDLHDKNRVFANGKGSFERVLSGIKYLEEFKVPFNILCVVTDDSCRQARKIMDFFLERNFDHLQFIPALPSLEGKSYLKDTNFAEFLSVVFDIWFEQLTKRGRYISIRFIDDLFSLLKYGSCNSCDLQGKCSNQRVVEADGSVYPCDFYVGDSFKLGSVTNLTALERPSLVLESFLKADPVLKKCSSCQLLALCKGGCRRCRLPSGESFLCKTWQMLFNRHHKQIKFVLNHYL